MNVNVSEKVENRLRELAIRNGQSAEDLAGVLLEEIVEERAKENGQIGLQENGGQGEKREKRKHNLLKFAGMFSGGDGKTSENYKKILLEEVDSVAGFTTDKRKD